MKYPLHECFYTFQGEGSAMGMPAFFIRLFGCPVKCNFCDSAGTWHPDYVPKHVERKTAEELTQMAIESGAKLIVITGGEPTIFDLEPLVAALQDEGKEVHLETSGAFEIKGDFDWIMLSPKRAQSPLVQSVELADEFKLIIEAPEDILFLTRLLLSAKGPQTIWLHPEWSKREDPLVLAAIVNAVKTGHGLYRAGWQIHKLYNVDRFDSRSQPLVPLGGNPNKGF